jgi:hypothetical protein
MSTNPWRVDPLLAHALGMRMRHVSIPQTEPVPEAHRASRAWAEIVFVSICHATNWDRLHEHMLLLAQQAPEEIAPGRLRHLDARAFNRVFGAGIDPDTPGTRRRLTILRDLGRVGERWLNQGWLNELIEPGLPLAGQDGLYARLADASCFREDPLAKKARVLAHQLLRLGLIEPSDLDALAPAIDYHLIRLYLRTGRVRPASPELMERLSTRGQLRLPQVTRLRESVEDAMWYTSAGAGLRIDWVNHIEWQIARSVCVRAAPRCASGPVLGKPLDDVAVQLLGTDRRCPLFTRCAARHEGELARLREPTLRASYY